MLYALIMAGGAGTRLWPCSRQRYPKQFLNLLGSGTLLEEAQERIEPLISPSRTFVVTHREFADLVASRLAKVPTDNILIEPEARGTASAIGLAAVHLRQRDPSAVMAVLTADHLITRPTVFRQSLAAAERLAEEGWLVTIGIHPTRAETGYGYVEQGEALGDTSEIPAYRVARFVEKPDQETAEALVASGCYAWNAGMFVWRVDRILQEFAVHMPMLYDGLVAIERSLGTPEEAAVLARFWQRLPSQTIDYGVMEHAQRVAVIPSDIGWSDVGDWSAVYDALPHDDCSNAVVGQHISLDTQGSLVVASHRPVVTLGLADVVVVDTQDVLLVCPRSRTQDVKQLVTLLKEQGLTMYL